MKKNLEFILKVIWSHKSVKHENVMNTFVLWKNQSSCSEDTCLGGEV